MTPEQKQQLKKLFSLTAAYYQRELSDAVLAMYVNDLADLDFQKVAASLEILRKEKNRKTMPMPADILNLVVPQISRKTLAIDMAKQIEAAIVRKGYAWAWETTFKEEIHRYFGPVGWEVIRRNGGWQSIHDQYFDTSNATAFSAQLRDQVEAVLELEAAGKLYDSPAEYTKKISQDEQILVEDKRRMELKNQAAKLLEGKNESSET